jgi:hypothetical protein
MKILDRLAQKVALHWLKGKADKARKEGSDVTKILDGNKRLVVCVVFVLAGVLKMLTGYDVSQVLGMLLPAVGWSDRETMDYAVQVVTFFVPLLVAAIAAGHGIWKGWKQVRAGATLTEVNSLPGYVKQAQAEGLIPPKD